MVVVELERRAIVEPKYAPRVPDEKPPRLVDDERATLLALLDYQRNSLLRKVSGLAEAQAVASPVGSGTSLLWLVNHVADAEATWVLHRFAGRDVAVGDPAHAPTLDGARVRYQQAWRDADAVIGDADLEETCAKFDDQPTVNLRWIVAHLLEETARHAGHADILRELIDGNTGR